MNYRLLIIDDNETERKLTSLTVQKLLSALKNKYCLSACSSPDTVPDFFTYDLYIIDIHMQKEKDGFQLAKTINVQNPSASVIFCTNYDDLVFEAYYIDILFFVRKNHLEQDMLQALMKYEALNHEKHTIVIRIKTGFMKISISDILYVESSHNSCILHTIRQKEFVISKPLSSFLKDLKETPILKISSSAAVNMSYVTHIDKSTLYFSDLYHFPISRRHLKSVKDYFMRETSWK